MPIAPSDIRAQQFRIVFRGYDVREVDDFLDRIEEQLAGAGVHAVAGSPAAPGTGGEVSPEEDDGSPRALRTVHLAEQMADKMVADATAEAAEIRARARAEAQALLTEARAAATAVVTARRPPQAGIDDTVLRVQQLLAELDRLGDEQRRCRDGIRAWLDEHDPHDQTQELPRAYVVPNVTVRRVGSTPLTAVP